MMSQDLEALWNSGHSPFENEIKLYIIGISIALFISSTHLALEVFHFMFKSFQLKVLPNHMGSSRLDGFRVQY